MLNSSVAVAEASLRAYSEGVDKPQNHTQDASMCNSMCQPTPAAIPLSAEQLAALLPCGAALAQIAQILLDFRSQSVSPQTTQKLEEDLQRLCREVGRSALEHSLNSLETTDPDQVPEEIKLGGTRYRRRFKSPHPIDSVFGSFYLRRWLYEPCEAGERCLFPLDLLLGLAAGRVTPALAGRVGRLVAQHTQRSVLLVLRQDNGVQWSHALLRKVSAEVAASVAQQRQAAQIKQLLGLLKEAFRSRGPHEPVLAVGRDGVMTPISGDKKYQEASVATVAVYDRNGRRLGTVYLGQMPEALQQQLSKQLTALIQGVLAGWKGPLPRLVYLSDGGQTPEAYYKEVLRKMDDPGRSFARLQWQRVLDYYHATEYVSKLAEALFGEGRQAQGWARRMRGVLKQAGGLTRLLQSASYHRNQQNLTGKRSQAFWKAYRYLNKRRKHMDYASYRAKGLPIGSGVTEAGCKVVVSQRLKLSGMKWQKQGGQVILNLRVVWLSGVWDLAWNMHIREAVNPYLDTYEGCLHPNLAAAA
jgi:hypothetical protein